MLQQITDLLREVITKAAGAKASRGSAKKQSWVIQDSNSGGIWCIDKTPVCLTIFWYPDGRGAALILVVEALKDEVMAKMFKGPVRLENIEFKKLGIHLLNAIPETGLPDRIHKEFNDFFEKVRANVNDDFSHAREVGLTHSNQTVREAFEKAEQMYKGKALDGQVDPKKVQ